MEANNRSKNVALNASWAIVSQLVVVIFGIASRKVFLDHLGAELLGVNGLFSDVLSLISFADLGFGTAIMFSMYGPIARKEFSSVASYLLFFKRIYNYVICAVILISVAFVPFLSAVQTDIPLNELRIYYLLFQISNVIQYVWAYRESYVIACQEERKLSMANLIYAILSNILLIVSIIAFESFISYLVVNIACITIKKVILNVYITRKYPITRLENAKELQKDEKKSVLRKSMALLVTKIGNLAINQTDSLIVSYMLNVTLWGFASNYLMIKKAIFTITDKIYASVLPSMGNLVAFNDKERELNVFLKYDFLNSWLHTFCFVGLACLSTPFVSLVFGENVTLSKSFVFVFCLASFIDGLRSPISILREATGSYEVDKWYTIVAAIVNLGLSIPLAHFFGLNGVFIGTIFAMIVLHIFRTFVLFRGGDYSITVVEYLFIVLKHILLGIAVYFTTDFFVGIITGYSSGILSFILSLLVVAILPNLLLTVVFNKNAFYLECRTIVIDKLNKILSHK